jgi:ATP-dependent RNA helicase DHX29
MQGIGDIFSLVDRLSGSEHFRGVAADWIIPLHSSVSAIEQQKAFEIPPVGVRKVRFLSKMPDLECL